jgi:RNA polymerase sigma-70 factor (ECF subfamily)
MRLGDESALEHLYARYGGLVYTLAMRIVGDAELAREVLQDTFIRSWDGRATYDAQRGRVAWWLMGIARNRAVDLLRSRSHQARLREQGGTAAAEPRAADRAGTEDLTDAVSLRNAVVNALRALSPSQRQAIELAYYGGRTQVEVAQELGEPLGTVKSRTREAMDRLRQLLWPLVEPIVEASRRRD